MRFSRRSAGGALSVLIFLALLTYYWLTEKPPETCALHYKAANQTLHRLLNTLPLNRLVLHSPLVNDGFAEAAKEYGLLIVVPSLVKERSLRDQIRREWAAPAGSVLLDEQSARVIFLVGNSIDAKEEATQHGDILQVDVPDTYRNLVYKIETGFRWVGETLRAEFVAKIDSDTVVAVDRLYEQLKRVKNSNRAGWVGGFTMAGMSPRRNPCSKWFIAEADYPFTAFPTYVDGPAYVMDARALEFIVATAGKHKVVEVEDVFLNGIVVAADQSIEKLCLQEIIATKFTPYSDCDASGAPSLAVLSTHGQAKRNLSAALAQLHNLTCHSVLTRVVGRRCSYLQ